MKSPTYWVQGEVGRWVGRWVGKWGGEEVSGRWLQSVPGAFYEFSTQPPLSPCL